MLSKNKKLNFFLYVNLGGIILCIIVVLYSMSTGKMKSETISFQQIIGGLVIVLASINIIANAIYSKIQRRKQGQQKK